jgi:hypothetical protein
MEIKVLGLGHVKSILTEETIRKVLVEESINAQIKKVTGCKKIASYGIFLTPSVVIDGEVKCVGRIPNPEEIRAWITQRGKKRGPKMNWMESICGFMEDSKTNSQNEWDDTTEKKFSENAKEKSREFEEQSNPRDGMSDKSATFLIGQCANNTAYKVYGLENKGRYFTARVLDKKGKVVNELLVDKLNGHVKFIR